jgi:hypothetical protein
MLMRALTQNHLAFCLLLFLAEAQNESSSCRNIPGDAQWPSASTWSQLNQTVHGQLIANVPQASVCHTTPYNTYDEVACQDLQKNWDFAQTLYVHLVYIRASLELMLTLLITSEPFPSEIMNPAFQNQSCDPFTPTDTPCELGNYATYSINVTGANDVIAGINFARRNNVRLVIKNTGHE